MPQLLSVGGCGFGCGYTVDELKVPVGDDVYLMEKADIGELKYVYS